MKYLYFLLGSATLAFAVILGVNADIGLGAFDALSFNGSAFYGLTIGVTMNIHILLLLVILMFVDRKMKYVLGTFIALSTGVFVDFFNWLFTLPDLGSLSFIYFIIAIPFFPLGVGMMINSSVPVGPIEQLPLSIAAIKGIDYTVVKTAFEVLYVALAFTFGQLAGIGLGGIMIGTIIITLYIGPGISLFRKILPNIKGA